MKLAAALLLAASSLPGSQLDACNERGVALFMEEQYKRAAELFEHELENERRTASCLIWYGRALGRRAERATGFAKIGAFSLARKTRASFEEAVEVDPRNLVALESLLDFYVEAPGIVGGSVEKAEALAERIFKLNRARGYRARATIHRNREEYDQAEAALEKAVELEPDEIDHLLSLASFLARQGWYDRSDALYARAFECKPDSPQVWFSRAAELVRAERKRDEARKLLERYLKAPLYAPDAEPYSEARKLLAKL